MASVDLFDNIIMSPITNKTTFVFEWKNGRYPRYRYFKALAIFSVW